jgi:hypothetical protein
MKEHNFYNKYIFTNFRNSEQHFETKFSPKIISTGVLLPQSLSHGCEIWTLEQMVI